MGPGGNRFDRSAGAFGRTEPGSKGTDDGTPRLLQLVVLDGSGGGPEWCRRDPDRYWDGHPVATAPARPGRRLRGRVRGRAVGAPGPTHSAGNPGLAGRRDGRWDAPPVRPASRSGRRTGWPDAGPRRSVSLGRTGPRAGGRPRGGNGSSASAPGDGAELRNLDRNIDRRALGPRKLIGRQLVWWPQQWNPRPACRSVGGSNP